MGNINKLGRKKFWQNPRFALSIRIGLGILLLGWGLVTNEAWMVAVGAFFSLSPLFMRKKKGDASCCGTDSCEMEWEERKA